MLPFLGIDGLPDLGQLERGVGLERAHHVADQVVAPDLDRRVVAPLRRVADLRPERGQLGVRLLLRLGPHPLEPVDALAVGGAQVLDERVHAGLGRRREVLLDVDLAEQLAERRVEVVEGALPPRLQFGHALQRAAAEVEAGVDERRVQVRREAIDGVELQIGLPLIDRRRGHGLAASAFDEARLRDDHSRGGGDAQLGGPRRPVEPGELRGQVGDRHLVVGLHRVAALDVGPVRARQARLERQDVSGGLGRIGHAAPP